MEMRSGGAWGSAGILGLQPPDLPGRLTEKAWLAFRPERGEVRNLEKS